ncbi:MAG: hypothetical protein HY900_04810 [Deltaproteobacteria bacterium]|nr:hypothetical protein [Deltaproteobacteria bacterium]
MVKWAAAALVFALAGGASSVLAFDAGRLHDSALFPAHQVLERQLVVPVDGGYGYGHRSFVPRERVFVVPKDRFFAPRERVIVVPRDRFFAPRERVIIVPRERFFVPKERFFFPKEHFFFPGHTFPHFHRSGIQFHIVLSP